MTFLRWYSIILIILMLGAYFYNKRHETSKINEITAILLLLPILIYLVFS